jgi:hypothetical protein
LFENGPDPELEVEEFANSLIKSTLLDDLVGEIIDSFGISMLPFKKQRWADVMF